MVPLSSSSEKQALARDTWQLPPADAQVWSGVSENELIAYLEGEGAKLRFFGEDVEDQIRPALSPASNVRLLLRIGGLSSYLPASMERLRERFPFLSEEEAARLLKVIIIPRAAPRFSRGDHVQFTNFAGARVELPGCFAIAQRIKSDRLRQLIGEGLGTQAIAQRLRCSTRWVRSVKALYGGSSNG